MTAKASVRQQVRIAGNKPAAKTIVVIPTYNEAANLPSLFSQMAALGIPGLEILIVDDNSPDGTADAAERLSSEYDLPVAVFRRPGKQGLGTAYVTGFSAALAAGADYVIEMDADLSHAPEYVPVLLNSMADVDVAVGSRWAKGGGADKGWGWGRLLLSRGAATYSRAVLGLKIKDPTGGFKCFRAVALKGLPLDRMKSQGFAFQVEMAYTCQRRGYRIAEIPIIFRSRATGKSKMSAGIIIEAMWRVLAMRLGR